MIEKPDDPRNRVGYKDQGPATKAKMMDAYRKQLARWKAQYGPRS